MSRSSNSVFSGSEYSEILLVIDVLNLRERNVGYENPIEVDGELLLFIERELPLWLVQTEGRPRTSTWASAPTMVST